MSIENNRLTQRFARQKAGEMPAGLWPFITAGYPDIATTPSLIAALEAAGAAGAEIGFPYSDPIADGPVIQTSYSRALEQGLTVGQMFDAIATARADGVAMPLVGMVSHSIVHRVGPEAFAEQAAHSGLDGLIVPDISLEEAAEISSVLTEAGLTLCMLVAPTTSPARRQEIAAASTGFTYYVSVVGITGERSSLAAGLADAVSELREQSRRPVVVGFGISRPEHVAEVTQIADGAIVGSALIRRINEAVDEGKASETVQRVRHFVGELSGA